MRLRRTPRAATWFLREYCPNPGDESVIGDLIEQYQRGRGRTWFWLQGFTIVFVGLYRNIRRDTRAVIAGLVKVWLVRGLLQVCVAGALMVHYRMNHHSGPGETTSSFPLMTFRVGATFHWPFTAITVIASLITLAMAGMDLASSSKVRPRTLVLAYLTLYIAATIGSAAVHTFQLFLTEPNALGFLMLDLLAVPAAPAIVLWGASLRKKKTEAESVTS